jgi:site-specific recombinase XerD
MIPRNPRNERLKREYREFLRHASGKADQTICQVEKAILRYEHFTGHADFQTFDQQKAKGFKADLGAQALAKATILSTVTSLKRFFGWLAIQPGYKSKIKITDIEFLSLSEKDIRAAKAPADRPIPTLEQVLHVIHTMPHESPIDLRNRALIAFIAITGTRDGAVIAFASSTLIQSGILSFNIRTRWQPNSVSGSVLSFCQSMMNSKLSS